MSSVGVGFYFLFLCVVSTQFLTIEITQPRFSPAVFPDERQDNGQGRIRVKYT